METGSKVKTDLETMDYIKYKISNGMLRNAALQYSPEYSLFGSEGKSFLC